MVNEKTFHLPPPTQRVKIVPRSVRQIEYDELKSRLMDIELNMDKVIVENKATKGMPQKDLVPNQPPGAVRMEMDPWVFPSEGANRARQPQT